MDLDTYKTISSPSEEILFKEKNSKFYGYAFPLSDDVDVKSLIEPLRRKHPKAGHFCYAWQIGAMDKKSRAIDDGEPANTAGMPILGQIQSFEVTDILIVVVRIFGGVKLGVGGLITAYRAAAQLALQNSDIVEKTINLQFAISFDYKNINRVMRIIKEKNIDIVTQKMGLDCKITIAVRKNKATEIFELFGAMFEIKIEKI